MNVDPKTGVQRVIAAFPAAVEALQRLGIDVLSNEPLYKACEQAGVDLADVQTALANIDWSRADESTGVDAARRKP